RRGLLRILHRFLTSCLPASLIIRSPFVGRQGARRPAGTEGQKSLDRLEPTLKVRHEMMLGKKIALVQYLRAIRPSSPKWHAHVGTRFVNHASLMFRLGSSQGVFEGRRSGVPT